MQRYHEKLGLSAFVLSLFGVLTAGLLVIPALICAVLSKRAADRAGLPRDGFATAAVVVCACVLLVWAGLLVTGSVVALGLGLKAGLPRFSQEDLRNIVIGTGVAITLVSALVIGGRVAGARRMRRLAGRG
ncbi:MAG: hypothetical protein QM755_14310 [Luteolibacter sp.]